VIIVKKMRRRWSHIELSYRASQIRTFDNEVYMIKGNLAVNKDNGDIKPVSHIYYNVRNVRNHQKKMIAKRKSPADELCKCQ
jgi:hypothetical protein